MNRKNIRLLITSIAYLLILSVAFGVFYIFKPYRFIDNDKSAIICSNNNSHFEIGWNFIYSFDGKFDAFNDIKARKLCEYGLIKDYGNTLKTPGEINYNFKPEFLTESNWGDALLMFAATVIFGIFLVEGTQLFLQKKSVTTYSKKNVISFLAASLILVPIIFFSVVRKPAAVIYCKRQVAHKINNFKRVIFKYGVFPIPEEDAHIKTLLAPLYDQCLTREGISLKKGAKSS